MKVICLARRSTSSAAGGSEKGFSDVLASIEILLTEERNENTMKKTAVFMVTVLLVLSIMTGIVVADSAYGDGVVSSNSTFKHKLTLTEDPYTLGYNIAYKFTVEGDPKGIWPNSGETYDATGFVTGNPVISSVAYHPGDAFPNGVKETTATVDWSHVTFYEPGNYYWKIKEAVDTDNTDSNIPEGKLDDDPKYYYIWAAVTDKNLDGKLEVEIGQLCDVENLTHKEDPERQFPATTVNLTVKKTVTGNQGSRDQYFPFAITIYEGDGVSLSHTYKVTGNFSTTDQVKSSPYNKNDNVNQPTNEIDARTKPFIIWLKHGEDFKIEGLPYGCGYKIEETAAGYTTITNVEGDTDCNKSTDNKIVDDSSLTAINGTIVAFTNNRDADVPTGVYLETCAPVLGLILAAVLLTLVFGLKRREENL